MRNAVIAVIFQEKLLFGVRILLIAWHSKTTGLLILVQRVKTMRGNTKEKLIEAGAGIIHLKGFNHTGIKEILDVAGVPKGSFYNYFESKEDFGLQVIDYFTDYFSQLTESTVSDPRLTSLEKVRCLLTDFIALFESHKCAYGCPIGNLSQEMGDLSPAFQKKLKDAIDSMAEMYGELIREAQSAGELPTSLDAREAAYFIVSSWHGALVRMKVEKSTKPLNNHFRFIVEYVLKGCEQAKDKEERNECQGHREEGN